MKNNIRLAAALTAFALLLAACGQGKDAAAPSGQPSAPPKQSIESPAGSMMKTVRYYVSDPDMTGLTELTAEVEAAPEGEGGIYRAALEAMQRTDEAKGEYSLWQHIRFNRVSFEDGKLTVDVTIPDEARLGAPGEALALEAITKTAFQFEEVRALDILVDGEPTDSLMGHEFLEHPILRESALTA